MKKKVYIMATTATAVAAAYSHQAEAATYTVKANDSLWSIASKYNTSVTALKKLNNLTSNLIFPNQPLVVSGTVTTDKPAATTTVTTKQQETTAGSHTVQSGESLYIIAMKYGTTYTKLMELNNLSSYLIFPGQQLKISAAASTTTTTSSTTTTTTTTPSSTTTTAGGTKYTVQAGDYLSKIAVQYGVTVEQLKLWNGLTSNIIYPNQQLVVSKAVTTTTSPAKQAPQQTTTSPVFNHPNWYDYGQCTWYVFNKRAAIGKGISTYWWNANNWANGARNDGYTVNRIPEVGAIAQTAMGALGHVAFVERVNADGTILVSEMNYLTPPTVVGYRTLTRTQLTQYVFIH
ncbi:LysM peptidoglycan-binding domain-containing protein [Macrococcus equipercicus]